MRRNGKNGMVDERRLAFACTFIVSIAVAAMFLIPSYVIAGPGPKSVRGYIWDIDGRLLEGADVTVNIRYAGNNSTRATATDTTGSDGFYAVSFGPFDYDVGDLIEVIATKGGQQANYTAANSGIMQWVNVTFPYAIPEFGSMFGYLAAGGAIGVVGIALVAYKRKK